MTSQSQSTTAAVTAFIDRVGGEVEVAYRLSTPERPISQFAVRKWRKVGRIPDQHWPRLATLFGVDVMELYRMHKRSR